MRQTAVEWLEKIRQGQKGQPFDDHEWEIAFNHAKEMEKGQIIETWHNGYNNQSPMIDEENCGQNYYNETFKL
jgi:hypothetical protein